MYGERGREKREEHTREVAFQHRERALARRLRVVFGRPLSLMALLGRVWEGVGYLVKDEEVWNNENYRTEQGYELKIYKQHNNTFPL